MKQIADWLRKLGMPEYAERFAEERIEFDVLPELTDQDLERLGIPLGHRQRMLRAIRDLGNASVVVAGTLGTRSERANSARRRRTPPADCDVHRPRWFDGV